MPFGQKNIHMSSLCFFVLNDDFLHTRKHFKKLIKHRLMISPFWRSDFVVCIVSVVSLLVLFGIMCDYVFTIGTRKKI